MRVGVCLFCSLCRTCFPFPAPGFLFSLLHHLFIRHLPSESPWPGSFLSSPFGPVVLLALSAEKERRPRRLALRGERWLCNACGWDPEAGLWPAPCLLSLRPLNARLRCKDYPGRIMPGVNTSANKSACVTLPTPLGPGPLAGEENALLAANYK